MSLKPGAIVSANLRLVKLLGRGAMGSVWAADHQGLGTQVAVKFMSSAVLEDPVSVARFAQEAQAAARIKSPHVVQTFDHGVTADGERYIVMELLDGESLERHVRRAGPLELATLTDVVTQLCKALARAHALGIVHRDIKPANIFLTSSHGELLVKVLDFGVAKLTGEDAIHMTTAGNMVGTPAYMSPEQFFRGHQVDHRCDLWSVAVVAYQALAGELPFNGVTLGELCLSIKRGTFAPLRSHRPDLPPALEEWMARALHRDPAQRFTSARQMAEQLEQIAGCPSVMASSPSVVASGSTLQTFQGTALDGPSGLDASGTLAAPSGRSTAVAVGAAVAFALLVGAAAFVAGQSSAPASSSQAAAAPATPAATTSPASDTASPERDRAGEEPELGEPVALPTATASASAPPLASVAPPAAPPAGAPARPAVPRDERARRAAEELGL